MPSQREARYNRMWYARKRGSRSYKTEMENAHLLLAWEAGDLSEGQAARALGIGRVELRKMRDDAVAQGRAMWTALVGGLGKDARGGVE